MSEADNSNTLFACGNCQFRQLTSRYGKDGEVVNAQTTLPHCRCGMKIWVDADACPVVIKDILFRAAQRTGVPLILVANQPLRIPSSPCISMLQVAAGFDVADNEIVKRLDAGDLVVTSDIPLAAEVLENGGQALSVRGELYSLDNIRSRLNMRDFMDTLRASGINTGGKPTLNQNDRKSFANQLDRFLTRMQKNMPKYEQQG